MVMSLLSTPRPRTTRVEPPSLDVETSPDKQSKSFIHLHRRLYLSLFDKEHSVPVALHELNTNFLIIPFDFGCEPFCHSGVQEKSPISLAEIYNFDCMMRAIARQNPSGKLVLCIASAPAVRAKAALLIGCHMILSLDVSLKRTVRTFAPLNRLSDFMITSEKVDEVEGDMNGEWKGQLTAAACWGALNAAKAQGWIDLAKPFTAGTQGGSELCVEEYLHYLK